MTRSVTAFRMDSDLIDYFEKKAEDQGMSRSEFMRRCMFLGLEVIDRDLD